MAGVQDNPHSDGLTFDSQTGDDRERVCRISYVKHPMTRAKVIRCGRNGCGVEVK